MQEAHKFLRLTKYLTALQSLQHQRTISISDLVMAVRTISPEVVQMDMQELGIVDGVNLEVHLAMRSVQTAIDELEVQSEKHPFSTPLLITKLDSMSDIDCTSLSAEASRANIREAAWEFVESAPDHFLFALARMEKGRGPFCHQIETVKTALETYGGTAIVADEVGLGKTIVGCLLAMEILATTPEANVLILVPANLIQQWCSEFLDFFGIDLTEVPHASVSKLSSERVVLISSDRAKHPHVAPFILAREWELLIVDEAHELRNADSLRTRLVYTIRALNRVYLTATPVQNSGYDMYNLITSLRPGFLNVRQWFTDQYMLDERSVCRKEVLQSRLSEVMTRNRRQDVSQGGFSTRLPPQTVWVESWTQKEASVYEDLLDMLRGTYRRNLGAATAVARPSGLEQHVSQFVLVSMLVLREMASHPSAALKTLNTALRARLEDLALALGDRSGLDNLDRFIEKHSQDLEDEYAHAKSKLLIDHLLSLFQQSRSVLVYVVFRETLNTLSKLIEARFPDVELIKYHGELSKAEKELRVQHFKKSEKACFLSMDSGGQGLNLQAADTVINYDYPWNPMKVEQRIGRIDRYGQKSDTINIINLITRGTIEVYVYNTLQTKIEVFRNVIGDVMSPLEVHDLWEDHVMLGIGELILSSRDAEDMRSRFEGLDENSLHKYLDRYERYMNRRKKWIGQ